jgi:hypothetical protein
MRLARRSMRRSGR